MSDMLKVTTPMVNKNQPVLPKNGAQPLTPFDIQDPTRVVRTHNQSELMQQNHGMIDNGDAPVLLMNLLKDPAVAVSYLKNIFLLEEIFKLLPANNKTVTKEIEQIFHQLLMKAEDVKNEMVRQEHTATMFKGKFFDFLRTISETYRNTPEVQVSIANLLKAINNLAGQEGILDAVSNSLEFLKSGLTSNKGLSQKLDILMEQFRQKGGSINFLALKEQTLEVLKEVEDSLLFSPKMSKVVSIIIYNLSRYNNNMDYFNEAAYRMRQVMTSSQRQEYISLLEEFTKILKSGLMLKQMGLEGQEGKGLQEAFFDEDGASIKGNNGEILDPKEILKNAATGKIAFEAEQGNSSLVNQLPLEKGDMRSKVMEALVQLINHQAAEDSVISTDSAKIDKILYSLLSSPCNFTPLLHFIVPMMHDGVKAFAEIWINPNSDEKDMPRDVKSGKHFLLVIDIDHVGRFEAEFYVYDNTIDFNLFCPQGYAEKYEGMMKNLPKLLRDTQYKIGETRLETLERSRSLMDVFKSLPYRRVGVDVKI